MASDEIKLWRWRYINEFGKRVENSWHMSEEDVAFYRDAETIEGTLEVRQPIGSTGDFMRSPKKS